jgi:hypothetical protein
MASTVGNRPAQYRARAQQSRKKAATAPTESARKALLQDAELWERMADYEEKIPTQVFDSSPPAASPGSGDKRR